MPQLVIRGYSLMDPGMQGQRLVEVVDLFDDKFGDVFHSAYDTQIEKQHRVITMPSRCQ